MTTTTAPSVQGYLESPLTAGEPDVAGPLAVFPLFGPSPRLRYRAFAQAVELGVVVRELPGDASVNDLLVENPTDLPVLLYDGEEVAGAQQDRTFDVSVLVAPGSSLRVPVSCVEAGRWDGSRHSEAFAPGPSMAYPELRRLKSRRAHEHLALGREARAAQDEVWAAVDRKHARHGVASSTGAMRDVFAARGGDLDALRTAVRLRDRQVGMLVAIAGRFTVLDHASDPAAFAALHGPLVRGYALDALETLTTIDRPPMAPPSARDAAALLGRIGAVRPRERDGLGRGREARFADDRLIATALVDGGELVQLTAFVDDPADHGSPPPSR